MNAKFKLRPVHYSLLLIFAILIFLSVKDVVSKNEIRNNGKNIIVMLTKKEKSPKTITYYFTYYHNDVKNVVTNSDVQHSILKSDEENMMIDSLKIGSYYYAKFLPKYPKIIIVNPAKEVTDKKAIEKAGFEK